MKERGILADAVATGDPRKSLEAIRDQLAAKLDSGQCATCGGPRGETAGLASIAKQLIAVIEAIEALPRDRNAEVTPFERLLSQRAGRVAEAQDSASPGKAPARREGGRRPGGGRRAGA